MTTTSTHVLYTHLVSIVEKNIEKANRRAKRLGLTPYTISVVEADPEPVYDETRIKGWHRVDGVPIYPIDANGYGLKPEDYRSRSTVTIGGITPKLPGGWEFIGIVTEDSVAGPMPKLITDQARELNLNLDQFRNIDDWNECEHCHTRRNRRTMFLLRSALGEIIRVGKTCVHSFLGLTVSIPMDRFGGILEGVEELAEVSWSSRPGDACYQIDDVLKLSYAVVSTYGWLGAEAARWERKPSTGERVGALMTSRNPLSREERNGLIDSVDAGRVADIRRYIDEMVADSEYASTIKAIVRGQTANNRLVSGSNLRILASTMCGYLRELAHRAEAGKVVDSAHVGTVGKREMFRVEVTFSRVFDGVYGERQLVKMVDPDGNQLVWWNTGQSDPKVGGTYNLMGTVKDHGEYNGVKQTTLTRCKLVAAS